MVSGGQPRASFVGGRIWSIGRFARRARLHTQGGERGLDENNLLHDNIVGVVRVVHIDRIIYAPTII